jgi:phosphatidylglycerol:prolipoprotein diacylglycerol transferase
LFVPLLAAAVLIALFFAVRAARSVAAQGPSTQMAGQASNAALGPLGMGAFAAALLWVWSRNPVTLHSYGLMLVLGFGVAAWLSCREAERRGINPNIILDLSLPLLFVSIVFCRILYVLQSRSQFPSFGDMLRLWDGGLSFHGSLVAAPLVVWFFAWRNKLKFGQIADCIAPSVFIGYAIARIGCLLNGCCYGNVCTLPWAMQFPDEQNRGVWTAPSHPAQLYSSLMALALFFVMQRMKDKPQWNRFSGQLTLVFFAFYAVERFVMEIFRNGATAPEAFGQTWLTLAQFVSVVGLVVIAALWMVLAKRSSTRMIQPPASGL